MSGDSNPTGQSLISQLLHEEGTAEAVQPVRASVVSNLLSIAGNRWYDLDQNHASIASGKFECVVVDGPEACNDQIALARYPTLPFLRDHLDAERLFVLRDDAERTGGREIRRRWRAEMGIDHRMKVSKSACGFRGTHFNRVP